MNNFEEFMPEDFDGLASKLSYPGEIQHFLTSVRGFLLSLQADGGADEDLAYIIGKRLTKVGTWKLVPSRGMRLHVRDIPVALVEAFLSDAPDEYRRNVVNPPKEKARDPREMDATQRRISAQGIVRAARALASAKAMPSASPNDAVEFASAQSHWLISVGVAGTRQASTPSEAKKAARALKKALKEVHGPDMTAPADPNLMSIIAAIESNRSHEPR